MSSVEAVVAEIVGVDLDEDGIRLNGRPVFGGGDVDVEGNLLGFHGRFLNQTNAFGELGTFGIK